LLGRRVALSWLFNIKTALRRVMLAMPRVIKINPKHNKMCSKPAVFLGQVPVQQRCHLDYLQLAASKPVSMQG
jgi:hypothetical protein